MRFLAYMKLESLKMALDVGFSRSVRFQTFEWHPGCTLRGRMGHPSNFQKRGVFERLMSIFAVVKNGEGRTAFLMTLNVFILLTAYYVIKPVREALILGELGAE